VAKPNTQFDLEAFKETQQIVKALKEERSGLKELWDRVDAAFLMKSDEMATLKKEAKRVGDLKVTIHPWARIASIGCARLMSATEPEWSVPKNLNTATAVNLSDKIEKLAKALWYMSGRIAGGPIHYDIALSALLYAGIDIQLVRTKDLYDELPDEASKAEKYHYQRLIDKTPLLFQVVPVREGYGYYDDLGALIGYYKEVEVTVPQLRRKFTDEELEEHGISLDSKKAKHKLGRYCDHVKEEIWFPSSKKQVPVRQDEHDYPTIPYVSQLGEGSKLFTKPEHQRQPFLYSYIESGLWQRHNLLLTRMFTNVYKMSMNPQTVFEKVDDTREAPEISTQFIGGIVEILKGESLKPLEVQALSDDMTLLWTIANELSTESTIFKQALGEPLGANAPFSMVALLAQAGRLPLVTVQRQCNWAISTAMEYGMRWLREEHHGNKELEIGYGTEHAAQIKVGDIPEYVTIKGDMQIDLPQDNKSNADTAIQLTVGDQPLTSQRYAREKLLKIGDSKDMDKEIAFERMMAVMNQQAAENKALQMSLQDEQGNYKPDFLITALMEVIQTNPQMFQQLLAAVQMQMQQAQAGAQGPEGLGEYPAGPPGEMPMGAPTGPQGGPPMQGGMPEDLTGGPPEPGSMQTPEGEPLEPPFER